VDGRQRHDTFLQIDDDESGLRVNGGDGHGVRFLMTSIVVRGAPMQRQTVSIARYRWQCATFMTLPGA
jgi:hypothetical protein